MNNELHSLPEALAAELKQLASQIVPQSQHPDQMAVGERVGQLNQTVEPAVHRALAQIAYDSPELLASIILAQLGVTAIEVTETEEHREDRLVEGYSGYHRFKELQPFKTRKTIKREVRLVKDGRGNNGRRR